jgi:hypothetical protein
MNLGQKKKKKNKPTNGFVSKTNFKGLSGQDPWKKHVNNESIEWNV